MRLFIILAFVYACFDSAAQTYSIEFTPSLRYGDSRITWTQSDSLFWLTFEVDSKTPQFERQAISETDFRLMNGLFEQIYTLADSSRRFLGGTVIEGILSLNNQTQKAFQIFPPNKSSNDYAPLNNLLCRVVPLIEDKSIKGYFKYYLKEINRKR